MKNNIKEIIKTLKELKTGAKMTGLILALLCFIADMLFLLNGYHTPNIVRGIYFTIAIFSIIFISNDFFIWLENKANKRKREEKIQEEIRALLPAQMELLRKIVKYGCLHLKLEDSDEEEAAFSLRQKFNFIRIEENYICITETTLKMLEKAFKK